MSRDVRRLCSDLRAALPVTMQTELFQRVRTAKLVSAGAAAAAAKAPFAVRAARLTAPAAESATDGARSPSCGAQA